MSDIVLLTVIYLPQANVDEGAGCLAPLALYKKNRVSAVRLIPVNFAEKIPGLPKRTREAAINMLFRISD